MTRARIRVRRGKRTPTRKEIVVSLSSAKRQLKHLKFLGVKGPIRAQRKLIRILRADLNTTPYADGRLPGVKRPKHKKGRKNVIRRVHKMPHTSRKHHCSACHRSGHNIRTCTSRRRK
jgi:hypothetical protein